MEAIEIYSLWVIRFAVFVGFSLLIFRRTSYALWLIILMYLLFPPVMTPGSIFLRTNPMIMFYTRWVGLSGLELVMLWTLLLLSLRARFITYTPLRIRFIPNRWFHIIFLIVFIAFLNGIFRSVFLYYANTPIRVPFGAVSIIAYIYFMAHLAYNLLDSEEEIRLFIRNYWRLVTLCLVWGCIKFILFQFGLVEALSYRGIVPIILYQSTLLMYAGISAFLLSRWLRLPKEKRVSWIIFSLLLFFLLITTRRLTYILLISTIAASYVSIRMTGHLQPLKVHRRLWNLARVGAVLGIVYWILPPEKEILWKTIISVNIWSEEFGYLASGAERLGQIQNLFENLKRGDGYLFGMGIGTYWREYILVPHSPYTIGRLVEKDIMDHVAFVLPLVNWLYRFGILGTIALWMLIIKYYRTHIKFWNGDKRPAVTVYAISFLVYSCAALLLIGDSRNAGTVIVGAFIGFVESLRHHWTSPSDLFESKEPMAGNSLQQPG